MTARPSPKPEPEWYTTAEVAKMFRVNPKIPVSWDKAGKFPPGTVIRTPGNHLRFNGDMIRSMLAGAR